MVIWRNSSGYFLLVSWAWCFFFFFFQAEDGIRDFCLSRGLGDVYKRQNKRRHGFSVDGGGSVGCRIYTVHNAEYLHWIANNTPTEKELNYQRARVFNYMPKISIVVPLYNTPEKFLRQMIESVQAQTYSNWELCLADGSTSSKNLGEIAHSYEDARILYRKLEENKGCLLYTSDAAAE